MIRTAAILQLAGCTTTNINAPQPNLQSINLGHPSCVIDCQTTQTATQSIGDGDVQGATVSTTMTTLKHTHPHHIEMTPRARKIVSFIIALALTVIMFNVMAIGQAHAAPTAWGQPMPPQCVTRFEWKSPGAYPVHVYDAPGCARPWAENAVSFWRWFQSVAVQPKQ